MIAAARTLFVDDDQPLLRSIERNLKFELNMSTADSGSAALQALADAGPFSVVVADMRMPQMDGIQFIQEARKIAPDAVYMMLTGNQDLPTAIKAVNEGQVFRLLTKPCEAADIKKAIAAAQRQFELEQMEKDLLHRTFFGAIDVIADVIDSQQSETVQQAEIVVAAVQAMERRFELPERWEIRLASRLSLVGLALLPRDLQSRFQVLPPSDPESHWIFTSMTGAAARLIGRIPRLGPVAEIIARQTDINGRVNWQQEGEEQAWGNYATLLRIATHWTTMIAAGASRAAANEELRAAWPLIAQEILDALDTVCIPLEGSIQSISVDLNSLAEGMVLSEDVVACDGSLLLRKGRKLSASVVEKLRLHGSLERRVSKVKVYESVEAKVHDCA